MPRRRAAATTCQPEVSLTGAAQATETGRKGHTLLAALQGRVTVLRYTSAPRRRAQVPLADTQSCARPSHCSASSPAPRRQGSGRGSPGVFDKNGADRAPERAPCVGSDAPGCTARARLPLAAGSMGTEGVPLAHPAAAPRPGPVPSPWAGCCGCGRARERRPPLARHARCGLLPQLGPTDPLSPPTLAPSSVPPAALRSGSAARPDRVQ